MRPRPRRDGEAERVAVGLLGDTVDPIEAEVHVHRSLAALAEAQVQVILTRYGKRLSDEQKIDLRRLVAQAQKASATLRSFPLENSDEPAMIFHIYRLER